MQDLNPEWEYVADTVMGGVSTGRLSHEEVAGREAARLTGEVSLDNNGGFVQMAFDVPQGADPSAHSGVVLTVYGNGATYDLRLRTTDLTRPWQSYRATFEAPAEWTEIRLPFTAFEANKTDAPFDAGALRRIGVLAYGAEMTADIAVSKIGFHE
ncbi:CIA30 family protein [Sulfitobacter albidus]|uniref:CIA30 family protein n=2 Tax=Sulfitobacter albidus TaxID=2829501 RepID=A0A975PNM7_9RHOB|nr:CIA30 family protein [Sulfitobacter albidus]